MKKFKGYVTDLVIDKDRNIFIKKFDENKVKKISRTNKPGLELMKEEVSSIKKLNNIKNPYVITPRLIEVDEENLVIKQKYVEGKKYYAYLLKNCNKFYFNKDLKKSFYEFGKFLGEFHRKNKYGEDKEKNPLCYLHGDLNSKNLIFVKGNKLFVFDPNFKNGSIYLELTRFLTNFYLINPLIKNKSLKI